MATGKAVTTEEKRCASCGVVHRGGVWYGHPFVLPPADAPAQPPTSDELIAAVGGKADMSTREYLNEVRGAPSQEQQDTRCSYLYPQRGPRVCNENEDSSIHFTDHDFTVLPQGTETEVKSLSHVVDAIEGPADGCACFDDHTHGTDIDGCMCCDINQPKDDDPLESIARELLRLEDWRFELAKREQTLSIEATGCVHGRCIHQQALQELAADLRRYGSEKKAAWQRLRVRMEGE